MDQDTDADWFGLRLAGLRGDYLGTRRSKLRPVSRSTLPPTPTLDTTWEMMILHYYITTVLLGSQRGPLIYLLAF